MKFALHSLAIASIATLSLTSCSPDDFNSGWDEQIIETVVTLNQDNSDDMSLGTLNIEDRAIDYITANQPDAESFIILTATPTSGSVVSADLIDLVFVERLDIYAVQDGNELLIGTLNGSVTNSSAGGIGGVDTDLYVFGNTDDIQLLLRPQYNEIAAQVSSMDIEINFALSFTLSGTK